MPIEVTCTNCGKTLRVKDSMAGKSGKCPQCGKAIRVPEPEPHVQLGQAQLTAHVLGVKVRGGVKKEDVPLRGTQMIGFARPVVVRARVAPQATVGLLLTIVGLLLALAPTVPAVPLGADRAPMVGLAGGLIGALGGALAGWGLLNIVQMAARYRGKAMAFTGLVLGIVAFVVGLMVFTGKGGAAAGGSVATKVAATMTVQQKAEVKQCAEQLGEAYKVFKSFADARNGEFPATVTELAPQFVPNLQRLVCPVAHGGTVPYECNKGVTTKSPPDTPLLYDAKGNHEGGRNVLLVSGKVVWMTEEELEAALTASKPAEPAAPSEGAQPERPAAASEGAGQPEAPAVRRPE